MLYEKLDYVLAVAEEQNLTRAAQKLYIAQSTLTMYLNRLEEQLGVKLFDRRKSPIVLTEAGRHYIKRMTKVYEDEQRLISELREIASPSETFSIGIGRVRGHHWLPPLLAALSEIYTGLSFQVMQGGERDILEAVSKDRIDVGIGVFPQTEDNLKKVELSREKQLLVAHRKFRLVPASERKNNSPDNPYLLDGTRLNQLPFICPDVSNGMYFSFQRLLDTYGIRPSKTIAINSLMTGLLMAEKGLGVQVTSATLLSDLGEEKIKSLDYCVLEAFPQYRSCSVVYRSDTQKIGLIRDTFHILREEVLPLIPFNEIPEIEFPE